MPGKVLGGDVVADLVQALFPLARAFLDPGVRHSFAILGEGCFFVCFSIQTRRADDAATIQLVTHTVTDLPREDGVLHEKKMYGEQIRLFGSRVRHEVVRFPSADGGAEPSRGPVPPSVIA